MAIILDSPSIQTHIQSMSNDYIQTTDLLGLPQNDSKDQCSTIILILGYEVDTNEFILQVPANKLQEAYKATTKALEKKSLNLMEADYLAGFLGFCALAVQLGRVFLRHLWSFIASFSRH